MRRTTALFLALCIVTTADISMADETFNHNPINGNVLFGRKDPSKYMKPSQYAHGGAGTVRYMELTPREKFTTEFIFVHRGVFDPKSGLGEHAHRWMEEMYFIMDNSTAEFTVNGRTAELPGPCMVLCPMGSSHGIYNRSDKPVEFMNLGVTLRNRAYDAVNFAKQDDLVNIELESPPPFLWSVIDRRLCMKHPVDGFLGGKGIVYYRQIWGYTSFKTNWLFVNHYVVTPGATIGYHRHDDAEEVYYVLKGRGRMTIDGVTIDVREGDTGSCILNGSHGFWNNSNEEVELLSIAVSMVKGVMQHTELDLELRGK